MAVFSCLLWSYLGHTNCQQTRKNIPWFCTRHVPFPSVPPTYKHRETATKQLHGEHCRTARPWRSTWANSTPSWSPLWPHLHLPSWPSWPSPHLLPTVPHSLSPLSAVGKPPPCHAPAGPPLAYLFPLGQDRIPRNLRPQYYPNGATPAQTLAIHMAGEMASPQANAKVAIDGWLLLAVPLSLPHNFVEVSQYRCFGQPEGPIHCTCTGMQVVIMNLCVRCCLVQKMTLHLFFNTFTPVV